MHDGQLVRATDGKWMTKPPNRCPNLAWVRHPAWGRAQAVFGVAAVARHSASSAKRTGLCRTAGLMAYIRPQEAAPRRLLQNVAANCLGLAV
jgi:hypothetical protein